jgi:hypothetical protein
MSFRFLYYINLSKRNVFFAAYLYYYLCLFRRVGKEYAVKRNIAEGARAKGSTPI